MHSQGPIRRTIVQDQGIGRRQAQRTVQPTHPRTDDYVSVDELCNRLQDDMALNEPYLPQAIPNSEAPLPIETGPVQYVDYASTYPKESDMAIYGVYNSPALFSRWDALGRDGLHQVNSQYPVDPTQQNNDTNLDLHTNQLQIYNLVSGEVPWYSAENSDFAIPVADHIPSPVLPIHLPVKRLDLSSVETIPMEERLGDYLNGLTLVGSHTGILGETDLLDNSWYEVETEYGFLGTDDFFPSADVGMCDDDYELEAGLERTYNDAEPNYRRH